ncbi:MAG: HPr family phosphocarrier protein [SAR324 cluster bacterium]|nr:HPr family phosphocarrier protein [SAR324 cluster bacterium]MBL7036188.1 HPr family phosphocarrier protein [SAR324 cluster bacterium]
MVSQDITIINRLGLHARAAAQLVRMANQYPCDIKLEKAGQVSNAKSVMEVLMLGATQGTALSISTSGDKEDEALKSIVDLFAARFNELE